MQPSVQPDRPCHLHARLPRPVTPAAEQDHQNMMEQLGIRALRPGPGGNEKSPNHANCDESKANPFPELPDPLKLTELSSFHPCEWSVRSEPWNRYFWICSLSIA